MVFLTYDYVLGMKRLADPTPAPDPEITIYLVVQKVLRHYHSSTPTTSSGRPNTYCEHFVGLKTRRDFTVPRQAFSFANSQGNAALSHLSLNLSDMGVTLEERRVSMICDLCAFVQSVEDVPTKRPAVMLYAQVVHHCKDDYINVLDASQWWGPVDVASVVYLECVEDLKKVGFDEELRKVAEECVICKEFELGSKVTCMPCSHVYHDKCIVDWLQRSLTCPLCRFSWHKRPTQDL